MKPFWEDLKSSGPTYIRDTITSQFKFKALPLSMCPYNESKCIPFPGVEFSELYYGYCSFSMSADVVNAMGTEATKVLESTGLASFQDSSTERGLGETLGKWMGDFEKSLPAYILVAFLSFLVGFIFMVLLRFLIGPCVWFAVFLVLLMLAVGGALCWVRSKQCAGAGLFETGQQVAVAVTVTATTAASQAISGQSVSEEMTGEPGLQFMLMVQSLSLPDGYTPKGAYHTYDEAAGTATQLPVSFFVFLWNNALNIAIGQCLIAGAVGVWFFTSNSQKGTRRVIAQSTWNVFRYHLGSLAFGSFIIAVIQFIRALMKYYEKQAKAVKNRVLVLVLKICGCIIWCFEKCVKFLNKTLVLA
eukprot:g15354.t1